VPDCAAKQTNAGKRDEEYFGSIKMGGVSDNGNNVDDVEDEGY
jgi:hypothetical protein